MKRVIFVLSLFCVFSFAILNDGYAQRQRPTPVMESKWIAGGNFGFGITNSSLYFSVAPQLGYRITPRWELGVRASYELNYYYDYYYGNQTCNLFGGSVYTNYQIFRGIFVHFEDELLYQMPIYNHQVVENDAPDDKDNFSEAGMDGVVDGVVHDDFAVGANAVHLFEAAVPASHSGSKNK